LDVGDDVLCASGNELGRAVTRHQLTRRGRQETDSERDDVRAHGVDQCVVTQKALGPGAEGCRRDVEEAHVGVSGARVSEDEVNIVAQQYRPATEGDT